MTKTESSYNGSSLCHSCCQFFVVLHSGFSHSLQCSDTVGWATGRASSLWKMLVCWWWRFDWSFSCLISSVVTTTSIILSSNKIQNVDILVPVYLGCPGKWLLNERRRHFQAAVVTWGPIVMFWVFLKVHLNGSVKEPNISIYFFYPSPNRVIFPMFCLLVEGECQILVF